MNFYPRHTGAIVAFLVIACSGSLGAQITNRIDSLNGWYIPYDSVTYEANKVHPNVMHFIAGGQYEVFGLSSSGKWMLKGRWERKGDTLFFHYDWSYEQTRRKKDIIATEEGVPYSDTLVLHAGKLHYADPYSGIPPFALVRWTPGSDRTFPVTDAAAKLLSFYRAELLHGKQPDKNAMAGYYCWHGDVGQALIHLQHNGKFVLRKEGDPFVRVEKGRWKMNGDTLVLRVKFSRSYEIIEENHVRQRKFLVSGGMMCEVTPARQEPNMLAMYPVRKGFYKLLKKKFRQHRHE